MAKKKVQNMSPADMDKHEDEEALIQQLAEEQGESHDEEPKVEEPKEPEEKEQPKEAPEVEIEIKNDTKQPEVNADIAYQLRELKRQNQELQRRVEETAKQKEQPKVEKPAEPEIPDYNLDPIGHLAAVNAQLSRQVQDLTGWQKKQEETTAAQQAEYNKINEFVRVENEFKARTPDYEAVSDHVMKEMVKAARYFAPDATPEQINKFVSDQVLSISDKAKANGQNSAEVLYNLGKSQFGYQPPAPKPVPGERPSLEVIEKNKRRSANGLTSGASKASNLTIDALNKMSPAELEGVSLEEEENILRGY